MVDTAASSGGALSILKDFYSYLADTKDENEWIFLLSDGYIQETSNIRVQVLKEVKQNWIKRLWFEAYGGGKLINGLEPDVVLSLQNTLPAGLKAKQYVYVHQTIPFQKEKKFSFFKKEERIYAVYQHIIGRKIKKSIHRADCTIVQTRWLGESIQRLCRKGARIIQCKPTVRIQEFQRGIYSPAYFLYPAAPILYKNHKVIEEACGILNKKGIIDFRVDFTCDGESGKNIRRIGNISREELFHKYTQGTLIFPSYIESFGYPLKEARMAKTMILAADCEYAHELLEGYSNAYFFPAFDSERLAGLMEAVIKQEITLSRTEEKADLNRDGWEVLVREICSEQKV